MDILIPIGLGVFINFVVFIIAKSAKQTYKNSLLICLFAFLIVLLSAFIIGAWLGMGIGVISLGMLIFVILLGFVLIINPRKK